MGLRGPRPRGAAHAKFMGYYRPSRHGPLPEPRPGTTPIEVSEEEQAKRKAELEQQRRAIYGENPPDPGSKAKRRAW